MSDDLTKLAARPAWRGGDKRYGDETPYFGESGVGMDGVRALLANGAAEISLSSASGPFMPWAELNEKEREWTLRGPCGWPWWVRAKPRRATRDPKKPKLNETDERALKYIREHPGMGGDTIAAKLGIDFGHFRARIVPKLKAHGVTNSRTNGYHAPAQPM